MSKFGKSLAWLGGMFLDAVENAGVDIRPNLDVASRDYRELGMAGDYIDRALSEGVNLEEPGAEDFEMARCVAETIVWFQHNTGFPGNKLVDPNGVLNEPVLDYGGASFRFFRMISNGGTQFVDSVDQFVEFTRQCKKLCEDEGFMFDHIEADAKPGYFYGHREKVDPVLEGAPA